MKVPFSKQAFTVTLAMTISLVGLNFVHGTGTEITLRNNNRTIQNTEALDQFLNNTSNQATTPSNQAAATPQSVTQDQVLAAQAAANEAAKISNDAKKTADDDKKAAAAAKTAYDTALGKRSNAWQAAEDAKQDAADAENKRIAAWNEYNRLLSAFNAGSGGSSTTQAQLTNELNAYNSALKTATTDAKTATTAAEKKRIDALNQYNGLLSAFIAGSGGSNTSGITQAQLTNALNAYNQATKYAKTDADGAQIAAWNTYNRLLGDFIAGYGGSNTSGITSTQLTNELNAYNSDLKTATTDAKTAATNAENQRTIAWNTYNGKLSAFNAGSGGSGFTQAQLDQLTAAMNAYNAALQKDTDAQEIAQRALDAYTKANTDASNALTAKNTADKTALESAKQYEKDLAETTSKASTYVTLKANYSAPVEDNAPAGGGGAPAGGGGAPASGGGAPVISLIAPNVNIAKSGLTFTTQVVRLDMNTDPNLSPERQRAARLQNCL